MSHEPGEYRYAVSDGNYRGSGTYPKATLGGDPLRRLGVEPGDEVVLEPAGDGVLTIRKAPDRDSDG